MIPEITSIENERASLTTIRNVGTVMSNIFVYGLLWVMLTAGKLVIVIFLILLMTIMGNHEWNNNYNL